MVYPSVRDWLFSVKTFAAAMLALSGTLLWRARALPCPADPRLASACRSLRKWSVGAWLTAAALTAVGTTFAFVLPLVAAR